MATYKKISKTIQKLTIANPQKNSAVDWLNVSNAGKAEIEYLRKNYGFKLPHLSAATAKANSQRPMIIHEDNYLFMILHFPVLSDPADKNGNGITSAEIEFFLGHGWLITLPNRPIGALDNFFNICRKDGHSMLSYDLESSAILLYEILSKLLAHNFYILDHNSIAISRAEQAIMADDHKKSADLILSLRHNLINLRKIMQNYKNIFKHFISIESSVVSHNQLKKYYGELVEETKNLWEILENQREMVEVIYDSYHSLSDYRLGQTMKTLTIFYVIFSSLSLVAAIFSMNFSQNMPLVNLTNGFWVIIAAMGVVGLAMILIFKKKRWL